MREPQLGKISFNFLIPHFFHRSRGKQLRSQFGGAVRRENQQLGDDEIDADSQAGFWNSRCRSQRLHRRRDDRQVFSNYSMGCTPQL